MCRNRAFFIVGLALGLAGCGGSLSSTPSYAPVLSSVAPATSRALDTESLLWSFGGKYDGSTPVSGLIADASGNVYGTTVSGGAYPKYAGSVYELMPDGSKSTEIQLYAFHRSDGYAPSASLVFDPKGHLYGTTQLGGSTYGSGCNTNGCGTVFEVSPATGGESVLYSFQGGADGISPLGPVVFDRHGNLFGTTQQGGNSSCTFGNGCGTVFELRSSGSSWKKTTIHTFSGTDGAFPSTRLAIDSHGNVLGTALGGTVTSCSNEGCGVIFALSPSGSSWTETVIHDFTGGNDGGMVPTLARTGLLADSKGNLYGATSSGAKSGLGAVYKLARSGSTYKLKVIYGFPRSTAARNPTGELSFDAHGNLLGAASGGNDKCPPGRNNNPCGTIYELSPAKKGPWKETDLFAFGYDNGGWTPNGGVVVNASGDVFGTTQNSNLVASCCGGVFELEP
jgi:uncharacterized repeat protein (TIGR03803 family)